MTTVFELLTHSQFLIMFPYHSTLYDERIINSKT